MTWGCCEVRLMEKEAESGGRSDIQVRRERGESPRPTRSLAAQVQRSGCAAFLARPGQVTSDRLAPVSLDEN